MSMRFRATEDPTPSGVAVLGVQDLAFAVADIEQATEFFASFFGAGVIAESGSVSDARRSSMREFGNGDVRAVIRSSRLLRTPFLDLKLIAATYPRQRPLSPMRLDIGGWQGGTGSGGRAPRMGRSAGERGPMPASVRRFASASAGDIARSLAASRSPASAASARARSRSVLISGSPGMRAASRNVAGAGKAASGVPAAVRCWPYCPAMRSLIAAAWAIPMRFPENAHAAGPEAGP